MTPSEHENASAEAATELLARRAQLQDWLWRLGEVGDDIPAQVAKRVRSDYEERLTGVLAELSEHSISLRADRERLDELLLAAAERHDAAVDALEEARLRHRIGELSADEWDARRPALEEEVEAAAVEVGGTEREIKALDELLGQISLEGRPMEGGYFDEATIESGAPVADSQGPAFETAPPDAAQRRRGAATGGSASDFAGAADEWDPQLPEIEEEIAPEEQLPELQAPAAAERGGADEITTLDVSAYSAETEERRAVEEDLIEITNFAAAAEALADEVDPAPADDDYAFLEELDRAIAATAPTGESDEEEADGNTRPQPGLKCPECGYSNDPAAWYCGVCGVDLA
jgi:hypothetical protein